MKRPDYMPICRALGYFSILKIEEAKLPIMPTVRYLVKQKKLAGGMSIDLQYLEDYWRMAGRNGLDVRLKSVKWPKNLKSAHDRQAEIERIKANKKKAEELRTKFEARLVELSQYTFELGGSDPAALHIRSLSTKAGFSAIALPATRNAMPRARQRSSG
jgi:hypothetical protein